MIRTIIAIIRFWIYLVAQRHELKIARKLERAGKTEEFDEYVAARVRAWAQYVISLSGGTVAVTGEENIPRDRAVVFVGNHQGNLDIPILLGYVAKPKAFIAKIELLRVPFLADWMKMMRCTFLDRKNMRQSVRAMDEAVENVKKGHSLVIFPEGTRSKSDEVAEFKQGSFKLALRSGAPIVPVTIDGSWHMLEEKGRFQRNVAVRVVVHPAISTEGLSKEETHALPERVRAIVAGGIAKK
jgi:1-acyl-sn-glycerol-3-phosphate acyltransferase